MKMKEVQFKNRNGHHTIMDKSNPLFDDLDYQLSCKDKKKYDSIYQAQYASDEFFKLKGYRLNAYKCAYCNKYHLTKRSD